MKPAAVPESGPGQNWLQLWRTKQGKLSAKSFHPMWKNKNQETFPFFFLAAVISCVNIFLPFPSSFHPWYDVSKNDIKCVKYWYMMCHRLIKCVKNSLFCISLCKALAWMLLPKFTLGPIWASPYGWRVFQFFTSAKWSIVVFTWNIYSNPCDLFNIFEFLATLSSLHMAMQKKHCRLNNAFLREGLNFFC